LAEVPLVLIEPVKGAIHLAAVSSAAARLGLEPGLTLADAGTRILDFAVADHDKAADDALLVRIAEDSDRWTPFVAVDPPHGLVLDITGCAHLFGGEMALRRRILARFRTAALTVRSAIAATPEAARALARFGGKTLVLPSAEAEAVSCLPVAALELGEEDTVTLRRAGLRCIGDLATQPAAALAARFGQAMTRHLARLLGYEDRRITPHRPLSACLAECSFIEPIVRMEDVQQSLGHLIERVSAILEERAKGGRVFEASFFRTDGAVRRVTVTTSRPSHRPVTLLRLFRETIDTLIEPIDPGFGFDLIRLAVLRADALAPTQPKFDGVEGEDEAVSDLLDRLAARLGAQRVLCFAATDTHNPMRSARLVPVMSRDNAENWIISNRDCDPGEPPLRPLRLFHPPQPIETLAAVPDGPPLRFRWRRVLHDVTCAEGPERIAAEWWCDGQIATRDYYRVEDGRGRRFWLFRDSLYGSDERRPNWYLHGLFA
jgi:protein ImuB